MNIMQENKFLGTIHSFHVLEFDMRENVLEVHYAHIL